MNVSSRTILPIVTRRPPPTAVAARVTSTLDNSLNQRGQPSWSTMNDHTHSGDAAMSIDASTRIGAVSIHSGGWRECRATTPGS